MKLTLIGGAGIRAPLVIQSALKRAEKIHLDEICLMDIDAHQLELIGKICQLTVKQAASAVRLSFTTDARKALEGADYVITTIRVGKEKGRVLDERIALAHRVLGQETTGPGGFAMAMRSIPAIRYYAALMQEICPKAYMFNFTNPAGLVTQALRDSGFEKIVGICDGANGAQHSAARYLQVPPESVRTRVFGLNHLSWSDSIQVNGKEMLPRLLADEAFLKSSDMRVFEPSLVREIGLWMNEYLYYYYYADQAVHSILAERRTRGEEIMELNKNLIDMLSEIDPERYPEEASRAYWAYNERRGVTYMSYARPDGISMEEADRSSYSGAADEAASEGYAGVALRIVEAFESGENVHIAVNVPNNGAIACMRNEDVVEISCDVDKEGIHPLQIGKVPEAQELLMRSVKQYERLASEAILTRSRRKAYMALMAHPLVMSYSLARTLVDEYLDAHREFVGEWN
ncbi:MAG: 6-phospho-beta-glucosidase [Anaerolineae bacterium]|nr:6-phospho-beta-glucosidase [Anaerolineae bacterium]